MSTRRRGGAPRTARSEDAASSDPASHNRTEETASPPRRSHATGALLAISACLVVLTLAAFQGVASHPFVNYDDNAYVSENPIVAEGLSVQGVLWAFTATYRANWHPLTWLSHMLDVEMFGLDAGRHHLVNLLLHTANVLLLFLLLTRMTAAPWRSAFAAALFAIHPMHVESVAWIAERKDVLSTFLWLLTLAAWLGYASPGPNAASRSRLSYVLALVLFALGLMAKPMPVTLPFTLLLLDYWPLDRIARSPRPAWDSLGRLAIEKIPFFALSALSCVVTFLAQKGGGAVQGIEHFSLQDRVANALVAYASYLVKTLWPVSLAIYYPHPHGGLPFATLAGSTLLLAGLSALALHLARRAPFIIVGWLWYLGTLVPVIGLVQVGGQAMADRYSYVPLIGVFVAIAWGATAIAAGATSDDRSSGRALAAGTGSTPEIPAGATSPTTASRRRIPPDGPAPGGVRDATTGSTSAASAREGSARTDSEGGGGDARRSAAQARRAARSAPEVLLAPWRAALTTLLSAAVLVALLFLTRAQVAYWAGDIPLFEHALAVTEGNCIAHNSLGLGLDDAGRREEAVAHYDEAVRTCPDYKPALANLGVARSREGRFDDAIALLQRAAGADPADAQVRFQLAAAFAGARRSDEAIAQYNEAIRLRPDYPKAHDNLANLLANRGSTNEAIAHYEESLRLDPGSALAHFNYSKALIAQGRIDDAAAHLMAALRIRPKFPEAHNRLGSVLLRQGRAAEAAAEFEEALREQPGYAEARRNLDAARAAPLR